MPKVFLSHNHQDKIRVHQIAAHLNDNLIECWIDRDGLQAGDKLKPEIRSAIEESEIFIAFLSKAYLESAWCKEEFRTASQGRKSGKRPWRVFLVLLEEREAIEKQASVQINEMLYEVLNINWPKGRTAPDIAEQLLEEIWKGEQVRFYPIKSIEFERTNLQVISFGLKEDLLSNFLQHWTFNLNPFISRRPEEDKPIKFGTAIGFSGKAPNWIYTYLAIPLANTRDVFVFNTYTEDFICVYARPCSPGLLGSTITYR